MENKEILLQILENTKQLNARLDNIEKTYDERFEGIEKRLDSFEQHLNYIKKSHTERFEKLETRLDNFEQHLDYIEKSHSERLTKIENIVTRMEKEHGKKLQVDNFVAL